MSGRGDNERPPALEAVGFSFSYALGDAGIGPLDWRVDQGAFQLLVGATGSGKTTLLRCAKPSLAPAGRRQGSLRAFGRSIDGLGVADDAALVGFVSQSPENQIVCDAVWHEIAFGLENLGFEQAGMRRRVAEVAHFFGIEPWFRDDVTSLSGGQKQLVALASVLALRPQLLLLDEPTSQLDPVAEKNFLHALFRVNRELGVTVVVATHAPEAMAAYATSAVQLAGGTLRAMPLAAMAARPLQVTSSAAPASRAPLASASPVVTLDDVFVRYARGGAWVLRGCDAAFRADGIHAVVGGNGCGKTTLLHVVAGALVPERGCVRNSLARSQALLPQDPKALFVCDTAEEELREWQRACGYDDVELAAALAEWGLAGRASSHPYDLSGGQQQMLAMAKLLLTKPQLLLLDEPTKGLDASAKVLLARALLRRAREGACIVMATHDLTFAALVAHDVTLLFDGEAACTQPTADFFTDSLFYRPVADAFARQWQDGEAEEEVGKEGMRP